MNLKLVSADIASRIPAMNMDSPINNAGLIERLIAEAISQKKYDRRWCGVFVGWPKEILGECHVDSSSRDENYAVVCYEGDEPVHGFLLFQPRKVLQAQKMWLMGETPDAIHEKVISR